MFKTTILLLLICNITVSAYGQTDSCSLRISLLTCSPGQELYSTFGHSALRVKDPSTNTDIIFNYGTFDFNDPDFYTKFLRGKLLYFVSIEGYSDFEYAYQLEGRSIEEQLLNLSCIENQKLFAALRSNADEANRYYAYDFFYDNCSTRLRDIVADHSEDSVHFENILPADRPSFRNLIHEYLNRSKQYWSKLGMDLLMGISTDRKVTNAQSMFLPDYLYKGFDNAIIGTRSLVAGKQIVLLPSGKPTDQMGWFTPIMVFSLLLVAGIFLSFTSAKGRSSGRMQYFDITLFLLAGLMGLIMMFMWFGTEHKVCKDNMNLLFAWPTHLIAAFFISRRSPFMKYYFAAAALTGLILIIGWAWWPQELNPALIPLVALLVYRSFRILKQ